MLLNELLENVIDFEAAKKNRDKKAAQRDIEGLVLDVNKAFQAQDDYEKHYFGVIDDYNKTSACSASKFKFPTIMSDYEPDTVPGFALLLELPDRYDDDYTEVEEFAIEQALLLSDDLDTAIDADQTYYEDLRSEVKKSDMPFTRDVLYRIGTQLGRLDLMSNLLKNVLKAKS